MTQRELEEMLVVASDTTEADDEPASVVAMREALELVKEEFKAVMDVEKSEVMGLGGLYVMGTARHESSRIDLQLRGRSGRQGDPGTSRFFLSFEDEMYQVFGGDKLKDMLSFFRVSDDMPIEAPQVAETLDNVQKKVEENYEGIRAEVMSFDEVLNGQRKVAYTRRSEVLDMDDDSLIDYLGSWSKETAKDIVDGNKDDPAKIAQLVGQFFPPLAGVIDAPTVAGAGDKALALLSAAVEEALNSKIKAVGREKFARNARYLTLVTLDNGFTDHLANMEALVESVTLRGYRGLDPKLEYQSDGYDLFLGLMDNVRRNAIFSVFAAN